MAEIADVLRSGLVHLATMSSPYRQPKFTLTSLNRTNTLAKIASYLISSSKGLILPGSVFLLAPAMPPCVSYDWPLVTVPITCAAILSLPFLRPPCQGNPKTMADKKPASVEGYVPYLCLDAGNE